MKIGLIRNEYGWERILEQEKVPWEIAKINNLSKYSLLILNSNKISEENKDNIKTYIVNGGALLTDALSFKVLDKNRKISKIYINSIYGEGDLFRNISKINIENYGYKIKKANIGKINNKTGAIYSSRIGKGFIIVLPFDLNLLILDERSDKIYLSSPHAPLKENISVTSKGDLRRLIINCFHYLHLIRNIPYLNVWYYPRNYETIFCYRIDLDVFNKNEINNIVRVIKEKKINFTWFLSVINNKNYENGIKLLHKLNQNLQSHSYEHKVYDSFEGNYKNILEADKFISRISNKVSGFASPFGYWNKKLGLALEKINYLYSSEFSLSYDDLPFYPYLDKKKSKVIQLPIYPICVGSLIMRLYSKEKMKSYFNYLINMQYNKQMPLLLYDHPNDGVGVYPEVLDYLLKKIKSLDNILITNLNEFARWWKKREKSKFNSSIKDNKIKIQTNNNDKDIYLRIILPGYKEHRLPLKNQLININEIETEQMSEFKENKIRNIDILKSKFLFSVFYFKILIKAIRKRLFNLKNRLLK
ncbi:MAG: polysaccharide deacetylase family protein [Nanoarchaeota archaeon]